MISYVHTVTPQIAVQIGESESILLNQLEYWISKCGRNIEHLDGKWIYNSHEKWSEQFIYWSISKLRRTIKSLEDLGLVKSTKVNAKKWDQTKWYSIDYEKYEKLLQNKTRYSKINIPHKNIPLGHFSSGTSIKSTPNDSTDSVEMRSIIRQNTLITPKVPMCSKWTDRCVQNERIIITKNNYIKNTSYSQRNRLFKKMEGSKSFLKNENERTLQNMLRIWNEVFEYALFPIRGFYNQRNEIILLDIYKTIFQEDLEKWRNYACKVNSSKFLMGEKENKKSFKASFYWLIRTEVIHSIMNGAYGVGDRELDMDRIKENLEQQEKELVRTIKKKIMSCIKNELDETKEMNAFTKYIQDHDKKDDKYNLKSVLKHHSSYGLLHLNTYEGLRKSLYESYLLKKHLGISSLESKKKIEAKINAMKENQGNRASFQEITREIKRIQKISTVKESIKKFYIREITEKIQDRFYV